MGVDIRQQAFHPACLNCGDCIAATTLSKTCPEEPLIRFRYGTVPSRWPAWLRKAGVLDARRAAVVAACLAVSAVMVGFMAARRDLDADVAALYERTTVDADGQVHNTYRVTLTNRTQHPMRLRLAVSGVPGLNLDGPAELEILAGHRDLRDLALTAPGLGLEVGPHPIVLRGQVEGAADAVELPSQFFVPSRRSP
jgi:polyferredoxin